MDNAAFHRSKKVKETIEHTGCKLIYLPPYWPDLNPIEHYWAYLKKKVKDMWTTTSDFYQRLHAAFCLKYRATLT
jgi:transposase